MLAIIRGVLEAREHAAVAIDLAQSIQRELPQEIGECLAASWAGFRRV